MKRFYITVSLMTLAVGMSAQAQQQPDAGRTLQELKTAPSLPEKTTPVVIQAPAGSPHKPGGPQVRVQEVIFNGNTRFTQQELAAALGELKGQEFDLAALKGLADRITAYYHAHDYPFARALVPAQPMKGGKLKIEVVEGRYGQIEVEGEDARAAQAQKFLGALHKDDVITGKKLERASLILDDQPGYSFMPVIRPGKTQGTGDLKEVMKRKNKFGGNAAVDNGGNRYTGKIRGLANLYADSPFMFGDRATLNTIYTEENMWYGSAGYSRPLGYSGLRGNVGYAYTSYELGKDFKSLDAQGTARIASAGLSYPLVRSQQTNLSLAGSYQRKWLSDKQGAAGTSDNKTSDVVPLTLNFDQHDGLGGGGVSYGALTWTHGVLDLNGSLKTTDRTTANTNGAFDKLNLDVARVQATPVKNLTVYGRVAGQLAGDNLDSSEDFGLGGPNGVRAYPAGESYGDSGVLTQVEARYAMGNVSPYVFYDYGHTRTNQNAWTSGNNDRDIGGAGIGARAAYKAWNADLSAAWRTNGGNPQSDTKDATPQLWMTVGYSF